MLSSNKNSENLNFSTVHSRKFKFSEFLLDDNNATSTCSQTISTLTRKLIRNSKSHELPHLMARLWLEHANISVTICVFCYSFIAFVKEIFLKGPRMKGNLSHVAGEAV